MPTAKGACDGVRARILATPLATNPRFRVPDVAVKLGHLSWIYSDFLNGGGGQRKDWTPTGSLSILAGIRHTPLRYLSDNSKAKKVVGSLE